MFYLVRVLFQSLQDFDEKYQDPRSKHLPLMGSYRPYLFILALYYVFVKHLGPKFMQNRPAFDLKKTILVYNAVQVILSAYIAVRGSYMWYVESPYPRISCMMPFMDYSACGMAELYLTYYYSMLKLIDFSDTVFFVLRKRHRQVTFLHVYHHIVISIGSYGFARYLPGGQVAFLGIFNCVVHVIMYSYYFLSALSPGVKTSLWWKKYITQVQIVQFLILFVHFLRPLLDRECQYPSIPATFVMLQNAVMAVLFLDFYYKAYIRKSGGKTTNEFNGGVTQKFEVK